MLSADDPRFEKLNETNMIIIGQHEGKTIRNAHYYIYHYYYYIFKHVSHDTYIICINIY